MPKREEFNFSEILHAKNGPYSISSDLAQTIWMFAQATDTYNKAFEKRLAMAHIKITPSEWVTLRLILSAPGPVSLTDISRFLSIAIQSVSQLLNKLEKRGLIKRVRSKDDKRMVKISITEKGFELIKEITPYTYGFIKDTAGTLSESEVESLYAISRKLRDNCLKMLGLDPSGSDVVLDRLASMISDTPPTTKK